MTHRFAFPVLLLALSACSGHPPLVEPSGPFRALNAGRWTPSEDDLRGADAAAPPARPITGVRP
ncbi:MAG TPA: hypothetical protein VD860_05400 [Azospirillum sp.]|nr:hypothetical protein [Azospirillum sp.]